MHRVTIWRRQKVPAVAVNIDHELAALEGISVDELRSRWRTAMGRGAPAGFSKDLIARALAYRLQEQQFGGLSARPRRLLAAAARPGQEVMSHLKVGSVIVREHQGVLHEVVVVPDGFCWNGQTYASLSTIARRITGTQWNGPRFFGLRGRDSQDGHGGKQGAVNTSGPRSAVGTPGATARGTRRIRRKESVQCTGAVR